MKVRIITQIGILFFLCYLGEILSALLPFTFPGSVISMILLFLLLILKWIKTEQIYEFSDFLLKNMAFFFIPAGVGLLEYLDIIQSILFPLLAICFITTILTFAVTSFVVSFVMGVIEKKQIKEEK